MLGILPVLEQVANAGAWAVDEQAQFTGGVLKGATGLLGGVGSMIADPVDALAGMEKMAEHIPMAGANPLKNLLPGWVQIGGNDAMLARLAQPETRARIRTEIAEHGLNNWGRIPSWDAVQISISPRLPKTAASTRRSSSRGNPGGSSRSVRETSPTRVPFTP